MIIKIKPIDKGKTILALIIVILTLGCQKQNEWLDIKPNKNTVVPETLADFQAVLDGAAVSAFYSTAGLVGADNFYLKDAAYAAAPQTSRELYTWNREITGTINYWITPYKYIELANIVLDGLDKGKFIGNEHHNIRGQALFLRSLSYYNLAQLFCKAYTNSANTDLGLPLRYTSDANVISNRSTLKEVYQQILNDAIEASTLLPKNQEYLYRPSLPSAYALLAKTYLNMSEYGNSLNYAEKCLEIRPQLLDFNNNTIVNKTSEFRFPLLGKDNVEILFYAESQLHAEVWAHSNSTGIVATELYNSYSADDLRKSVFYNLVGGDPKFKGTYTGRFYNFCGIATNEVYLICAENSARLGNTDSALEKLNTLLRHRYRTGKFVPITVSDSEAALKMILDERRKELPFVGNIRWEDLKRLNNETKFEKTINRSINGKIYTLLPNDKRYVLPIPNEEIQLSNIEQNQR